MDAVQPSDTLPSQDPAAISITAITTRAVLGAVGLVLGWHVSQARPAIQLAIRHAPAFGGAAALIVAALTLLRLIVGQIPPREFVRRPTARTSRLVGLCRLELFVATLMLAIGGFGAARVAHAGDGLIGTFSRVGYVVVVMDLCLVFVAAEGRLVAELKARGVSSIKALLGAIDVGGKPAREVLPVWQHSVTRPLGMLTRWLSGAGTVSAVAVLALVCMAASAGAAAPPEFRDDAPVASPALQLQPTPLAAPRPASTQASDASSDLPAAVIPQPREARFDDVCGADAVQPGDGAPDWAAPGLRDLYFKPGEGVGAHIAGCPEPVVVTRSGVDEIAYQRGLSSSGLLSIVVASRTNGPVIFLGQVAVKVDELLKAGLTVSGERRMNVAEGDLQFAFTEQGTFAFVRSNKGDAYVVLPPVATEAWVREMVTQHAWLWPSPLGGTETAPVVGLSVSPSGPTIAVVTVSPDGQSATISADVGVVVVRNSGAIVRFSSVVDLAPPEFTARGAS